ncbi:MAG TPA: S-layer homology domain-containing protein [Thermoanaerobaculia bacterium]|nr:S-layer homology domain-containing protein [Thermoanaerobaculia bacterium]
MKKCFAVLLLVLGASLTYAADPGANYFPPPCTGGVFNDVPCPGQYAAWIEELYNEGILVGCGGGNYCPGAPLTREQAAVAILRAEHRRTVLTGVGSCSAAAQTPNWAICAGTVTNPEIEEGMVIVGTYMTRVSDSQIPIRIFDIQNGQFSFEVQTGTSFMWLAAPLVPNPN